jgi:PTH1 family peptidyl-tRNA hydrolase
MVIDRMAANEKMTLKPGKGKYIFGEISCDIYSLKLLKPLTFMNLSGISVREAKNSFHIDNENLLMVLDDINLPFGFLRMRKSGTDGGHKGLASVIYHLEADDFPRLRIGIGKPENELPMTEYVLLNFAGEEKKEIPNIIDEAIDAIRIWCEEGIDTAMNNTNRKVE